MSLTKDEKAFLHSLVKRVLNKVKKEEGTITEYPFPAFIAAEKKYERFLKAMMEKLK